MNNQPVLFASTRCPNSAKILETLKALNKDTLCRILYIDNYQRNQLPSFLKSVPTLYIPDSKEVYVGKDIYAYISKPVTARREVPVQQQSSSGGVTQGAPAAGGEYSPWTFEGKGSMSDTYSSWTNSESFMDSDQLRYTFLGGTPAATAPEPQTKQSYDGAKQGRNDDLAARMEQMKKARETEFKGIARQ
jgi:hypothetical protein